MFNPFSSISGYFSGLFSHKNNYVKEHIPYDLAYENGIIQIKKGFFSKTYELPSINFSTLNDENQQRKGKEYSDFLGTFDKDTVVQITLYNKTVDIAEFQQSVLLEMRSDEFNDYREEYNEMLLEKMTGAKNNLNTMILMTITTEAINIREAITKFSDIDQNVTEAVAQIAGKDCHPLKIVERLDILNDIYNQDFRTPLDAQGVINGHDVKSFSLNNCRKQGIESKDVISPSDIKAAKDYVQLGNTVCKSYYVSNYPNYLKCTYLSDFASLPCNMLVSIYFDVMPQDEAALLLKRQGTNVSGEIQDRQKKNQIIDVSLLSPGLREAKEEIETLRDITSREDVRLCIATSVITIFANDMDSLKSLESNLIKIAKRDFLSIKPLNWQQEQALNSALPLGHRQIDLDRLVTSESMYSMSPFSVLDIRQNSGIYYGINPISKNMIIFDRTDTEMNANPNGCILGMPGVGKSFISKKEMLNVILNTDDAIYILDPEREYVALAKQLGGAVVRLENGSSVHINPLDLNLDNTGNDDGAGDPVKTKSGFVEALCEIMIGGRYGLSPTEKTLISRCVNIIYSDYVRKLESMNKKMDTELAPTLEDLYEALLMQTEREATDIALGLERYVRTDDMFAYRTNLDLSNRFTVYDLKDLGGGMKELGLHIALDNIWNNMIFNFYKGKRTWIYVDEFHFLMQKDTSAEYISQIWKRARKWNGVPTAITQNIEDMLKSNHARAIINNSPFTILLGQSPINKKQLSGLLNISPEEQKYIDTTKQGMGLLRVDTDFVPMIDSFPKDTKLYKLMSTKPDERI